MRRSLFVFTSALARRFGRASLLPSRAAPEFVMLKRLGRSLALPLVVLFAGQVFAQRVSIEPPLTNRPADFSNIVGKYDRPIVEASPTEVAIEEPITLRITITGHGPAKYEPRRECLRLFPESFSNDFYVEELQDEHLVDRAKKSWTFIYRLRPKHTKVDAIADITLVYYDPDTRFETKYADSIAIVVKPRPKTDGGIVVDLPLAPESFYRTAPIRMERTSFEFTIFHLIGMLIAPPLTCLVGAVVWRKYRPDPAERRRLKRSQAAEIAIGQLDAAGAAAVRDIVCRYLRDRFAIALEEPTPTEGSAFLKRRGFAKDVCGQCGTLLQACDALRFGRAAAPQALMEDAIRLIKALEADRCAR